MQQVLIVSMLRPKANMPFVSIAVLNDADVKMATTYTIIRKLVPDGNTGCDTGSASEMVTTAQSMSGQSTLFNRCVSDAPAKTRDLYESSLPTRSILKKIKFAY